MKHNDISVLDQYLGEFKTMQEGCEWYAKNLRFLVIVKKSKEFEDIIDYELKSSLRDKYKDDIADGINTVNKVISDFGWHRTPITKSVTLEGLIDLLDEAYLYMHWLIAAINDLPLKQLPSIEV